jgi:hypothetical protein
MKNSPSKKEQEKYYLERARSIYADFPLGELLSTEEPDFLVNAERGVLGIELTNFIRGQGNKGSKLRQSEVTCDRIVSLAQIKFEQRGQNPLQVRFNWNTYALPNKREENRIIAEIVEVVGRFAPQDTYQSVVLMEELHGLYLGNFISRISILRKNPASKSLWANTEAGIIGVSTGELQDIISSKEEKLGTYLQKCSSIWLLIVADGQHVSSNSDLGEEVRRHVFRGTFDKVLFYDSFENWIAELKIEANELPDK